ncbi:VOC family protein [Actinomadura montaniterrae]|uniref:Glyoxalase-like domain-containing protein n=1 Tax=Actinomadura montaniterrae TaxID=1803903 RepID=A0A6L3W0S1_9ACTN|nr:VOC family protein [Actinomadura montaniterrae]KAB2382931.1 hypothetical protein F9B16_13180 [Actinomadura montaniterrae]
MGQQAGAAKSNHGGRLKAIGDDMPIFASALKDKGVPVSEIARKLAIKAGKNASQTAMHHFPRIGGFPVIVLQHATGHVSPQWPDGASRQMHFDLATDDPVSADKRVLDAGGRRLRPSDDVNVSARQGSLVYSSPAGYPFCLRPA